MGFRAPVAFLRRSPRAVNAIAVGNGEARIRTMDSPRRPAAGARARDAAYCSSIGFRRFALNSLSVIQPFLPHLFQLAKAIDRAPRGTFMHRPGRRLGLSRFEGAPPQARRLWWLNITLPLEIGSGEKARIGRATTRSAPLDSGTSGQETSLA